VVMVAQFDDPPAADRYAVPEAVAWIGSEAAHDAVYRSLARRIRPGAVRHRAPKITKPGPAAAGGPAGGRQPARYVSGRPAAPLCW
jgi:hypothetical protein